MFYLMYKQLYAYKDGKSAYIMTWRGKQVAMCEEREPLQEIIDRKNKCPATKDKYYIEEVK